MRKLYEQHKMLVNATLIMAVIFAIPMFINIFMGGRPWFFVVAGALGIGCSIVMTPLMNNRYMPHMSKHNLIMMVVSLFISTMLFLIGLDTYMNHGKATWCFTIGLPIVLGVCGVLALIACWWSYIRRNVEIL